MEEALSLAAPGVVGAAAAPGVVGAAPSPVSAASIFEGILPAQLRLHALTKKNKYL